ncbi:hypothetical protein P7K49_000251, partial [Saguinus oedipus]
GRRGAQRPPSSRYGGRGCPSPARRPRQDPGDHTPTSARDPGHALRAPGLAQVAARGPAPALPPRSLFPARLLPPRRQRLRRLPLPARARRLPSPRRPRARQRRRRLLIPAGGGSGGAGARAGLAVAGRGPSHQ